MDRWGTMLAAALVLFGCVQGLAQERILDFGPEEFVQAGGIDIVVPGYSVPSFEDWNNDGVKDLIVGEGGGTSPGRVRVYLNVGTESEPRFADFFYAQADGRDLTVPPQGCQGAFPRLVYWDDDDRKDLLVGLADGTVKVFLNVADNNEPAFDAGTLVRVGENDAFSLNVGNRAAPILTDFNGDGLPDLLVGALDGSIRLYLNSGSDDAFAPLFGSSPPGGDRVQMGGFNLIVPSGRSSPELVDLDGDGRKHLLSGNTDGQILFYRNTGTESEPAFSGYTFVQSNGLPINLPGALRSRPTVCRWGGPKDGYWDLLVGYGDGKIRLYRGIPKSGDFNGDGRIDAEDFAFIARALDRPVPPEGSPADLNGDGLVDILDLRLFVDLWLAENQDEE